VVICSRKQYSCELCMGIDPMSCDVTDAINDALFINVSNVRSHNTRFVQKQSRDLPPTAYSIYDGASMTARRLGQLPSCLTQKERKSSENQLMTADSVYIYTSVKAISAQRRKLDQLHRRSTQFLEPVRI